MRGEKRGSDAAKEESSSDPRHGDACARGILYEIRVQGQLGDHWATWFGRLSLTHGQDGTTVLAGPVLDQAELHGILAKIRDLGLPLLAVNRIDL